MSRRDTVKPKGYDLNLCRFLVKRFQSAYWSLLRLHRKETSKIVPGFKNNTPECCFLINYLKLKQALGSGRQTLPMLAIAYFESYVSKGELEYDAVCGSLGKNLFKPTHNISPANILSFGSKNPTENIVNGISIPK